MLPNAESHLVRGWTGQRFPTAFAHPTGKGESSSVLSVLWGLANLLGSFLLINVGQFAWGFTWSMLALGVGIAGMSVMLARHFGSVYGVPG